MELQGIYGSIALWVDANAGVCATVRALFGAERTEAAAFAGPRELAVELDVPALDAWASAEHYATVLQNAPQRSDLTEASSSGRALGADTETDFLSDEQKAAYLDGIEQGLGRLYARVVGAVRAADPHFFWAASASAWVLCLPDAHFDAPDNRALLNAHGRALLSAGTGTALIVVDDVCELPSMSAALAVGARHLAERDELARLRRRLIAPRGPRDAWGALGTVARGALAQTWRNTSTEVLDTWERAVSDEAAVRQGAGISPWRRAHNRHAFDPRESVSLVGEQMAEALGNLNGIALIERALPAIIRWARDLSGLSVDSEYLVSALTWDTALAADVIRMGDVIARDYLRVLERATRSLPWPAACPPEGRLIPPDAGHTWKPQVAEGALARALAKARPTLGLELEGLGLETVEAAAPRVAALVYRTFAFELKRAVDIGDDGVSYTIMHTAIPPQVAVAED